MESIKHGNSETSGDKNGPKDDHNSGIGRSYECTFCKRGFTNAQALGGHMNIHRKDKVKAKAEKNLTKSKKKDSMINYAPSSFLKKISSDDQQGNYHRSSSFGGQMNYQSSFPQSNSCYPQGYNCHYASGYYGGQRTNQFGVYDEDDLGANLSIRIGGMDMERSSAKGKERDGKEEWVENEVDLELRLGQCP